jgi:hypothetical protein
MYLKPYHIGIRTHKVKGQYSDCFFRKDGKSFAAISIRRRKKKGKCPSSFLNVTGNWAQKPYN